MDTCSSRHWPRLLLDPCTSHPGRIAAVVQFILMFKRSHTRNGVPPFLPFRARGYRDGLDRFCPTTEFLAMG